MLPPTILVLLEGEPNKYEGKEMAKKAKTNKSAAIRAALTATPDKAAADIAKDVGVAVSLVYNIKAKMKKQEGKPKGKRGRKPGSKNKPKVAAPTANKAKAAAHAAPTIAHAALDSAFEFVSKMGGLLNAQQMIDKLRSIKERM